MENLIENFNYNHIANVNIFRRHMKICIIVFKNIRICLKTCNDVITENNYSYGILLDGIRRGTLIPSTHFKRFIV